MTTGIEAAEELAAPLDLLLTSSAIGLAEQMLPNTSWSRFAVSLARKPRTVASRAGQLGGELLSAQGRSDIAPAKVDKRFDDPAWRGNPLLNRTIQAYLAAEQTVDQLFSEAGLDGRGGERVRFVPDLITEGLSSSINPPLNLAGYQALIDTGGLSAVRGLRHVVGDMISAPGIGGVSHRGVRPDPADRQRLA